MWYGLLADLVVGVHLAYVAFVPIGFLLVLVGLPLRWQWIRNFWFRSLHFLMIAIVAFEAACEIPCPLSIWEMDLRWYAGQPVAGGIPAEFAASIVSQAGTSGTGLLAAPGILTVDTNYKVSIIGQVAREMLFFDWPQWVFNTVYITFAVLVLLTLVLAPPRWPKKRREPVPSLT